MKKIMSFLFILFIPFIVKAEDIEVKSIELVEKSDSVVINNEPKIDGINISFDISFTNVDDFVRYKATILNIADEDLQIEESTKLGEGEYIKYQVIYDQENKVIKKGETKEVTILVSYNKEVPTNAFDDGNYVEKSTFTLAINDNQTNPNTSTGVPYIIIGVIVISLITLIVLLKNKKKAVVIVPLLLLALVPTISLALRKVGIEVNANVHIKDKEYRLDTTIGSFSTTADVKSITVNFDNNKYMYEEFTSIQWGQRQRPEDNIILNVMKDHFTENSYVKVYDPNHNLLKSVTLSDFPKPLFNVKSGINYTHFRIVTALGVYDASDLTLELSEDLQQYQRYDVAYFMYSNNTTQLRTEGPWISNQEVIEQITNLEASNTEELVFSGFERDAHDSHLYHAKWAPPSHEK